MGPFVDSYHHTIATGNLDRPFNKFFDEQFMVHLKSLTCKVVLVPSLRDVHHDAVFPQPPLTPFEDVMIKSSYVSSTALLTFILGSRKNILTLLASQTQLLSA